MEIREPTERSDPRPPEKVVVCINRRFSMRRGEEVPSCAGRGSVSLADALEHEIKRRGLDRRVAVDRTFCLAMCAQGPNVRFYPGGAWFSRIQPEDLSEIVDRLESAVGKSRNPG